MRRRRRLFCLGAVVTGMLGTLATPVPPASATTAGGAAFLGAMVLAGPIGVPNPANGLPFPPNVPPGQHCALPLPTLPNNCHLNWGGHTRGIVAFGTTVCAGVGATVGKAGKAPASAGTCSFAIAAGLGEGNHVHGYCGLMGGQVQATFTSSEPQNYALDIHFDSVSNLLILSGHWLKGGQTGLLLGVVLALDVVPVVQLFLNATTVKTLIGSFVLLPLG